MSQEKLVTSLQFYSEGLGRLFSVIIMYKNKYQYYFVHIHINNATTLLEMFLLRVIKTLYIHILAVYGTYTYTYNKK